MSQSLPPVPPQRRVMIFDMDGTLTRPLLNFDQIRKDIGIQEGSILEAVRQMSGPARERAERILDQHEAAAAAASELQPGAEEMIREIHAAGYPIVLMTRNSRQSVDVFLQRHPMHFDLTRTRDDGSTKPSPAPVHEICAHFKADPADAVVIGDFHYDIICGNAAGSTTILFLEPGMPVPEWAAEADLMIRDLLALRGLLQIGCI